MRRAIAATDHRAGYLIDAVQQNVAENDFERVTNRVPANIGEDKGE